MNPLEAYAQYQRVLDVVISHQEEVRKLSGGTFETTAEVLDLWQHISSKAEFLFWKHPMWEVAVDNPGARELFCKVPIHWGYRSPGLVQVWHFGSNIRIVDENVMSILLLDDKTRHIAWFMVHFVEDDECELMLMCYPKIPEGHRHEALEDYAQFMGNRRPLQTDWFIPRFRSLGSVTQDTPPEDLLVFFGELSAGLAFLDSPLAASPMHRVPRAERRRLKKQQQHEPEIRVVTLRRESYPSGKGESAVDWDWKWLVRGHWRNQWYPSLRDHKPVFVAPYVKGPEDKPLKAPRESIYNVAR